MVNEQSGNRRRNLLTTAGFVFMMGVVLWIGLDLFRAARAQREIAKDVNEAMALTEDGAHLAALHRLNHTQEEWQQLRSRTSRFWMEKARPFDSQMKRRLGDLHKAVGLGFSDQQLPALAERHYTLALLHDPEISGVAAHVPMESFYTRNFELGWVAIQLGRNDPDSRFPDALVRFFENHYEGPHYRFDNPPDRR